MPVTYKDVSRAEADRMGALCSSEAEYTDPVRVYSIGNYSKEFCGGPHVHSTGEIGHIRIVKQGVGGTGYSPPARLHLLIEPGIRQGGISMVYS